MKRLFLLLIIVAHCLCAQDILIKVSSSLNREILEVDGVTFSVRPLVNSKRNLARNWYIATANERIAGSAWDMAHQLADSHEKIVYAEPNSVPMNEHCEKLLRALTLQNEDGHRVDDNWPSPDPYVYSWHMLDSHSQLGRARQESKHKGGKRIRVFHFDTGYSPANITVPEYLNTDLQKNFIWGEDENSAVDPGIKDFPLQQPGHGTSTMSVLAGGFVDLPDKKYKSYIGGAPEAEIVPVRISKTVILLQVSEFARALFYAIENDGDVVSMSMGGVASKLWGEAVNEAYEKGIVMVTAAGNNVAGGLPTHYVVYPAKFKRVIAACGVTYDHSPYFKEDPWFFEMQGNWGTEVLMKSAIAAYTPNVTAARFKHPEDIGTSGGGTSAATPQVAAAVVLWLQKYKDFPFEHPWQRVNAVHHALFSTARKDEPKSKQYYGNGILQAANALQVAPKIDEEPIPADKVENPYQSLFEGWETFATKANREMVEVELLRLEQNNPQLRSLLEKLIGKTSISDEQKAEICEALRQIPEASKTLVEALSQ